MAGLPQFLISTQTDPYWEIPLFDSAGNPLSVEGRIFEAWITPPETKSGVGAPVPAVKVLTFQDGLSLVPPTDGSGNQAVKNTFVHQVSRAFAQANFPRGELTADLLEVVDGARRLFAPVRLFYGDPAQIREFVADRAGITFGQGRQPIVTPVAIAGQAGRRGSGLLTGTLPPQPSDGEDGDYWIVEREDQANLVYGPKEGGEWPPQPSSTFGVGGIADVPGLPVALEGKAPSDVIDTTDTAAPPALTSALGRLNLIRPANSRWNILDFQGSQDKLSENEATQDWQPLVNQALATGEKIAVGRANLNFRSFKTASNIIDVVSDAPIDIACDPRTTFVVSDVALGVSGALVRLSGGSPLTDLIGSKPSLRWTGGRFSSEAMMATHGVGQKIGFNFMDLSQYSSWEVAGTVFHAGFAAPSRTPVNDASGKAPTDPGWVETYLYSIGTGWADSAINTHGMGPGTVHDCTFIGLNDEGIYGSGISRRLGAPNVTVTMSAGNPTATITTLNTDGTPFAHNLAPGSVVGISGCAPVGGVTLFGRYVVQTTPTANTFTVLAESSPSASGTAGAALPNTTIGISLPVSDLIATAQGGIGERYHRNYFFRCGNAMTMKRNGQQTEFVLNRVEECGGGILAGIVGFGGSASGDYADPLSHGKRFLVDNNTLIRTAGRPIVVVGPDNIVTNNRVFDYGRNLYVEADGSQKRITVSASNPIAGIEVKSGEDNVIEENVLKQVTPAWMGGAIGGTRETLGIFLRTDPNYKLGSIRNRVADNTAVNIDRAFVEGAATDAGNVWDSNTDTGSTLPSTYPGANVLLTDQTTRTLTPTLNLGGGSVTYNATVTGGSGRFDKSDFEFSLFISLTAISSPTGNVTISAGLPANRTNRPIPVQVTRQTLSGAGSIIGRIEPGETIVRLYLEDQGTVTVLSASALAATSRLAISGRYPAKPA